MSDTARAEWFARMLASSLDLGLQSPDGLLEHATPQILAEHLPREALAQVLTGALATGAMSAQHLVDTVGAAALADVLPEQVAWHSVADAALRSGLTRAAPAEGEARSFLAAAVQGGLDRGLLGPDQLIRHANPAVLTGHLPTALAARLLQASLEAGRMSPELVVDTLGVETLATYLPASVLWACVCEVAGEERGDAATAAIDLASLVADEPEVEAPAAPEGDDLDLDDDLGGDTQDEADDDEAPPDTFTPAASLPASFDEAGPDAGEFDDDPEEATVAVRTASSERRPVAPTVSKGASALLAQAKRRARLGAGPEKGSAGK